MKFILKINGSETPKAAYVSWTPVECILTVDEFDGDVSFPVIVSAKDHGKEGQLAIYQDNKTTSAPVPNIKHDFKTSNQLTFFIAGIFGHASVAKKDTYIHVAAENPSENHIDDLRKDVMVRVRKNANALTEDEIKIFLDCYVALGSIATPREYKGNYSKTPSKLLHEIVLMHTFEAATEIHGRESFHPWHRAYLMHLERELQNIDPRVTVPYWKFDEGADKVFTPQFIGKTKKSDDPDLDIYDSIRPEFSAENPMNPYKENTVWGPLTRAYRYNDPSKEKSNLSIQNETTIIHFSDDFKEWCIFEERRSHNQAHNAFTGNIVDVGRDPVDPLFFMMHANVDRLWAKWQEIYNRYDRNDIKTYPFQNNYQGTHGNTWREENPDKFNFDDGFFAVDSGDMGNFVNDKLWPWDKDKELSRPWRKWYNVDQGCGNVPFLEIDFPGSDTSNFSGVDLTVGCTIDYQGRINNTTFLGFDYDDIPYFERDKVILANIVVSTVEQNKAFLNKESGEDKRLLAADSAILFSRADQEKALKILASKDESKTIRLKSIQLIDESRFPQNEEEAENKFWFLEIALSIISDESESVELRSELIHKMLLARRSNRSFHSKKPQFLDILRGLLTSEHDILKKQAFEILASFGDYTAQDILVKEIEKPDNKLLPKKDAVFLLRQSPKNEHIKLFQNLVTSDQRTEVKVAAIEGLSTDIDSINLLESILKDKDQIIALRKATIQPLFNLNKKEMFDLAPKILLESKEKEGIAVFSGVIPKSGEVEFKTELFGLLTQFSDLKELKENKDLKGALNQLIESDPKEKSAFRNSFEITTDQNAEETKTLIEQVATKLLTRLEKTDNG